MFDAALKLIQDAVKETLAFIMADNGNYVLKEKKEENSQVYYDNNLIIIGVTGHLKGEMIFSFSDSVIRIVAAKMIGMEVKEIDKLAFSAIVEFANVLSGAATIKLVDYYDSEKLNMSPPVVINGRDFNVASEVGEMRNYRLYINDKDIIYIRINLIHINQN